ncbi:MAG: hypothetical protein H6705_18055 [Myxococcales bacterium]|nr:hypothetical protein [Myxococcales bacterium]
MLDARVVGFDDGATSAAIGARLDESPHRGVYTRRPFADRAGSRRRSTRVIWRSSRGVDPAQEAIGTGLYAVLADGRCGGWCAMDATVLLRAGELADAVARVAVSGGGTRAAGGLRPTSTRRCRIDDGVAGGARRRPHHRRCTGRASG